MEKPSLGTTFAVIAALHVVPQTAKMYIIRMILYDQQSAFLTNKSKTELTRRLRSFALVWRWWHDIHNYLNVI